MDHAIKAAETDSGTSTLGLCAASWLQSGEGIVRLRAPFLSLLISVGVPVDLSARTVVEPSLAISHCCFSYACRRRVGKGRNAGVRKHKSSRSRRTYGTRLKRSLTFPLASLRTLGAVFR
jgi:hypothetical protein